MYMLLGYLTLPPGRYMLLGYLKLPPGRYMLLEKKILALREELEEREAAIQVAPQYLNSYQ